MKRIQILLFFIILHHALQAKMKPLGHFNFGKAGNVTHAIRPEIRKESLIVTKTLDDKGEIEWTVEIKAGGTAWYVIEDAQKK